MTDYDIDDAEDTLQMLSEHVRGEADYNSSTLLRDALEALSWALNEVRKATGESHG